MTSVSDSRTAASMAHRQLGHDLVGHVADDALLDELATALTHYSQRLQTGAARSRNVFEARAHHEEGVADGDPIPSWDDRPISGNASPWSLEPDIRRKGDEVVARVTFHQAHEGAPQRAHGGLVAALFDDILGCVLNIIQERAFTGELTVRYLAPTPLHRELLCTCRFVRREGRKLLLSGELTDGEQVLATTTSTFIIPREPWATTTTFDPA